MRPKRYVHPRFPNYVCKLRKALYGLKQISGGFKDSSADPSLYIKHDGKRMVIICVYVDDLIITSDDNVGIKELKNMLKTKLKLLDLGELKFFLGIEVVKTNKGIWLSQRKYIMDMLKKFGMLACKPLQLLLDVYVKYKLDSGKKIQNVQMFRSIVGSLLYATITRPDISYAVGMLSQFMQEPTDVHLNACRRY